MTPAGVPLRDTFWNVPPLAQNALYLGGLIAMAIFVYGFYQHVRLWRAGRPEDRFDHVPQRVKLVAKHALGQARTLSQAYPGIMHAIMFWGFLALFMGTVLATIDYDITLPLWGYKLLKGRFYLFYETVLDLFGLFFVIGLGMAVWRRFVLRPHRVDPTARFANVLALLFAMLLAHRLLGLGPALVAGALLAVDPSFLFVSRHDWGSFSLALLCRCAGLWLFATGWPLIRPIAVPMKPITRAWATL